MEEAQDHERWLRRAIDIAAANAAEGAGGPFGSVITRNGERVAEGVNQVTASADPTAHAEVVAIRLAAKVLGTHDLSGCDLYTSCEPCPMCLGAILWARIDRVWYAASKTQAASAGFDDALFYREIALAPAERELPMRRALAGESEAPFDAWRRFSAKVPY